MIDSIECSITQRKEDNIEQDLAMLHNFWHLK